MLIIQDKHLLSLDFKNFNLIIPFAIESSIHRLQGLGDGVHGGPHLAPVMAEGLTVQQLHPSISTQMLSPSLLSHPLLISLWVKGLESQEPTLLAVPVQAETRS